MQSENIAILVVLSIVCIYTVGSLFYIQKKVGEFSSCSRRLKSSV